MFFKENFKKTIIFGKNFLFKRRNRIFLVLFLTFLVAPLLFVWTNNYIQQEVYVPQNGNIHVSNNSLEIKENGSFKYPFKSVSSALDFARNNVDFKRVFISRGVYEEKVEIDIPLSLIAIEEGVVIKNPEGGSGKTLNIDSEVLIANLEIEGGRYSIYVSSEGKIDILNSEISKAKRYGVYNEIREEVSDDPSIRIIRSNIHRNGRQGLYLQKANVYISNSKINRNGEEGLDLHIGMIANVRGNRIYLNGEGGIESEIGENIYDITGNVVYSNGSSGINMQSYSGNAKIQIHSNKVFSNVDHGLRCAIHSNISRGYFQEHLDYSSENLFLKNGLSDIDPTCNF